MRSLKHCLAALIMAAALAACGGGGSGGGTEAVAGGGSGMDSGGGAGDGGGGAGDGGGTGDGGGDGGSGATPDLAFSSLQLAQTHLVPPQGKTITGSDDVAFNLHMVGNRAALAVLALTPSAVTAPRLEGRVGSTELGSLNPDNRWC